MAEFDSDSLSRGERTAQALKSERLHFMAGLLDDLAGAYTVEGVRNWLANPREALGGKSPEEILSGDWDPAGTEAAKVRDLAASLRG
jgi:hypothetical protein